MKKNTRTIAIAAAVLLGLAALLYLGGLLGQLLENYQAWQRAGGMAGQEEIQLRGHAIECRINAENPEMNFRPSPGKIERLHLPGGKGIRVDTAVYAGYTIPPYYDSMIAKLIVLGKSRNEAIKKMKSALSEFIVDGIDTNVDFQMEIMNHPKFQSGDFSTDFIEQMEREAE